jgi:hypothetical protein
VLPPALAVAAVTASHGTTETIVADALAGPVWASIVRMDTIEEGMLNAFQEHRERSSGRRQPGSRSQRAALRGW